MTRDELVEQVAAWLFRFEWSDGWEGMREEIRNGWRKSAQELIAIIRPAVLEEALTELRLEAEREPDIMTPGLREAVAVLKAMAREGT